MKYKVFDVVELMNGNRATILDILKNGYRAEIVDENGERQAIGNIGESDIKKPIIAK